MNRLVAPVSKTGTPCIFAETSAWSASRRSVRELSAGRINLSCPKEPPERRPAAHAVREDDPQTRDAKWAKGLSLADTQTGR